MSKKENPQKLNRAKTITVKANKKGRHYIPWLNFCRIIFVPFFYLFKPFKYFGEKKPPEGACVFVSNHYTLFDIVYVGATTWEGVHFVSKRSVTEKPILSALTRAVKVIPVNRDGNDVRGLLDCFKCLKNGEKIVIYPEGTRNKTDQEMLPFKHGASIMAIKTKTPIVPMMIYKKPKLFQKAHILVGKPFEFTEYYDKKMTDEDYLEADNKLREIMLNLRAEHTQYLEEKKKKKSKK